MTNDQPDEGKANWTYRAEGTRPKGDFEARAAHKDTVKWTASEYVSHQKGPGWFVALGSITAVVAVIVYAVSHDLFSIIVVIIFAVIFGFIAARPPQVLNYTVNSQGITIGHKQYPFALFKSFSIMHDDAIGYISLLPLQRFMPPISMYYEPKDEPHIVEVIAEYLPHENRPIDLVDRLSRLIRF